MLTLLRDVDQSWLEGELNGKKGIFPKSYVEVCFKTCCYRAHKAFHSVGNYFYT